MKSHRPAIAILIAEDDPDDRELLTEAFAQVSSAVELRFVDDGEQLLHHLGHRGGPERPREHPVPGLILLDLNMPGMDGRETLRRLRADEHWRRIPVVVLSTSSSQDEIDQVYALGANSFITKPARMGELIRVAYRLSEYWLDTVQLPT